MTDPLAHPQFHCAAAHNGGLRNGARRAISGDMRRAAAHRRAAITRTVSPSGTTEQPPQHEARKRRVSTGRLIRRHITADRRSHDVSTAATIRAMTSDESAPDASVVPRSPTGVFLCGEPCGLNNLCRMGIFAARMEDDNSVSFDIECPIDYRETPNFAHVSWTAGVMSEMCGQFPLFLEVMAFAGTVQTRFRAPVPVGV
jgi:hypothetical protein